MRKRLSIGTSKNKPLSLPLDTQTQTLAILGIRGSGKTVTASVITEEALKAGQQVVIIDPLDVWWGLKSSVDGRRAGFPVIVMGGHHGDVPLSKSDGQAVADFVVRERVPVILSLRHMRKADQRQLVTDFAERLYHRKGEAKHRTPIMVVIDEADAFVPQRHTGGEARMVGAIEDLVRRGRASGFGVVLISQRAASVNKDVLTQIELLVAHRHTSPQDRKALELWIEAHDTGGHGPAFLKSLASLKVGEAWFWSPAWLNLFCRVRVRQRTTFDSSATPKMGKAAPAPKKLAPVDLDALRAKLASTIEQAKESDPKELKRRIAELEHQLRAKEKGRPADTGKAVADAVCVAVEELNAAWRERVSEMQAVLKDFPSDIHRAAQRACDDSCAKIQENIPDSIPYKARTPRPKAEAPAKPFPGPRPARAATPPAGEPVELNGYQSDLLRVLAARHPVSTPRAQLGALAHKSIRSSAFGPNLRGLLVGGYATESHGGYAITAEGFDVLGEDVPRAPASGPAALDYWTGQLPTYEATMLKAITDAHPKSMDLQEISETTGYSMRSSMFRPSLRNLQKLQFVTWNGDGVRAADVFFE